MRELERGNIEVGMNPDTFKPLTSDIKQVANRIVLGIIAAAFIVGLAILLLVYHPVIGIFWIGVFFVGEKRVEERSERCSR